MLNEWYEERLNKAVEHFENSIKKAHKPVDILEDMYEIISSVYSVSVSECVTDDFKKHVWAIEHSAKYITRVAVTMADDFDGNQEELIKNFRKEIVEFKEFMGWEGK